METWMAELKGRLGYTGISQAALAQELGVSQGSLSQWLRGVAQPPDDFRARADAALDRLEAAERAAQEARERVLAEGSQ